MKKFYLFFLFVTMAISSWSQLVYEPFDYPSHATLGLSAQSNVTWLPLNTGDSILVDNGSLTYPGLPASVGNKAKFDGNGTDYYRTFTSQTSGTIYSSFILNVASLGSMSTTGAYFTGFIDAATTTTFGAAVWTRLSTTAGKYNIGISTRSNSVVTWLAANLDPGTSYFIVRAYEIITGTANDVGKIWLNTTAIGGAEPAPDAVAVAGTDMASVQKIFLRQDQITTTPFIEVDEIRVGTTWADVTPPGVAAPSISIAVPLTGFGNTCINTTAGPNSFSISGTNLSTANVVVAALPGFNYSTTSGGTYTSTLSIAQPGGAFSQQVFVKFNPTAVQSYNGNIDVSGGGVTTPVPVAATGAGINTAPTVITGGASGVTSNSAILAGTVTETGCSAITAYGIEYSTTSGFPNGTGTQVASTNLSGGNFSSSVSGLTPATTYYYKAYATNTGGTAYGTELSFTTPNVIPTVLTATTLSGFGSVCINTTTAANSFTITGTNLSTANVTVGALPGFTYSTTSGGTYTSTLSIAQPGGSFSQQVFVKFTPTAVQSYNGNIAVGGGGTTGPINVAATGSGINTTPTVTTGAASAITGSSATLAGSITSVGCSAVTSYGIEYSTISGFVTGTPVISTNISGSNFTSAVTGLLPNTTYYYKAFAINNGGKSYGSQQSFTTLPVTLSATALTSFGNVCPNVVAGPNSFTITGVNLASGNITVGPLTGYSFSTTSAGTYTPSLTINQAGGSFSQQVFVKFTPIAVQSYNGNIPVSGGGATAINVAATGAGVNAPPLITTGGAIQITTSSAILQGTSAGIGCSDLTGYGIEYSSINGFANGAGTPVPANNINAQLGGLFSVQLTNLVQGATYYYKAYAMNNGGISYGAQQSFTVLSIPGGFTVYPVPAMRGQRFYISKGDLTPGYYGVLFYDSEGKLAYRKDINIQANFINESFILPGGLARGVYTLKLVSNIKEYALRTILVL